ncbi:MAG TPA: glutathione ABC transporter permease GsiC [Deltaproteobacteria bacterium]|nr:MAG: glutathione ABC transporter permease GsiC [Deltaproteobacteria bacterium GWC2_65_14]HBO69220.1 glutathione ABC transporter permease GsiC [Deltaproteobacteria bacterium]
MGRILVARLWQAVPVVLGVVTIVFLLIHLIPGDPVEIMLGENAVAAQKEELRKELKLDRPLATQYVEFLSGLFRGDLGTSFRSREPVLREILSRFPATLLLALASLLAALLVSLPLGVLSAMRPRSAVDHLCGLFSMLGLSMPNFWLGPLLILLFSIQLGLLPVGGWGSAAHLVLPAATMGTGMAAILTRMLRASLLEEIRREYVQAAAARGLSRRAAVLRHALRNALIPVLTVLGLQFGSLLGGSVITETIFSWPGIGRLTLQAIEARDYPLVQGCILFLAVLTVAVNLLTDLLYLRLDPRIRVE